MSNIVERLRKMAEADYYGRDQPHFVSPDECADEIERLKAVLAQIAEALVAHETRMGKLHDMVLEARDAIRPNLEPDSPAWLREAFDKLHAIHHGMGGDPLGLHIRAALEAKT